MFVSRQKAAEMLGVDPQTLSNYMKSGLIRYYTNDRILYLEMDDVENFLRQRLREVRQLDDVAAYCTAERERLQAELEREQALTDAKIDLLRARRDYCTFVGRSGFGRNVLMAYFGFLHLRGIIPERLYQIADCVLSGDSVDVIASRFGLTHERVRQLINRLLMRAGASFGQIAELQAEVDRLSVRCTLQHEELHDVSRRMVDVERRHKAMAGLMGDDPSMPDMVRDARRVYFAGGQAQAPNAKVERIVSGISVRLLNVLRCNQCETLYELCRQSPYSIARWRNMGRKTQAELDALVAQLSAAMGHTYSIGCFAEL